MLGLLIDTSSAAVTAGVVEFGAGPAGAGVRVLAERSTVDARGHGELLAPTVRDCLAAAGARPSDLQAVVAGVGPGPFTGLRVGLVTAAVLADVLAVPAYGVCSLDAIAAELARSAAPPGELLVAGDARRKEIYWARYAGGRRLSGPEVDKPVTLSPVAPRPNALEPVADAMAGAGARLYADVLGLPLLDLDFPPVSGLATVAAERVLGRRPTEPLTPLYLRRPDAVAGAAPKRVSA